MAPLSAKKRRSPTTASAAGTESSTYVWIAWDKRGKRMVGELSGTSAAQIRAELRRLGMRPQSVREKKPAWFSAYGRPVKARELALFSRQIATLMASGVPMVQSLEITAGAQKNPRFKRMLLDVKRSIEGGAPLYQALGRHPKPFDELYQNLIRAGESAGVLDTVLDTVATYKERTEALKSKIKKALAYPLTVLLVATLVSVAMLLLVVPVFAQTFKDAGATLPLPTQLVIGASIMAKRHAAPISGLLMIGCLLLASARRRSRAFASACERCLLQLPIIGKLRRQSAIARFARTLAVTFSAGVPLVAALLAVSGATGSIVYGAAVRQLSEDVASGHSLRLAMLQANVFPDMVVQMTMVGEESGALDRMLSKIADFYEEEVNNTVDTLSTMLEPLIMLVLGVVVGGMVISLYLPIFQLAAIAG